MYAAGSQVQRMPCSIISGGDRRQHAPNKKSTDGAPGIW
jgi:hypothetical protein